MKNINTLPREMKVRLRFRWSKIVFVFVFVIIGVHATYNYYSLKEIIEQKEVTKFQLHETKDPTADISSYKSEIIFQTNIIKSLTISPIRLHRFLYSFYLSIPEDVEIYSITNGNYLSSLSKQDATDAIKKTTLNKDGSEEEQGETSDLEAKKNSNLSDEIEIKEKLPANAIVIKGISLSLTSISDIVDRYTESDRYSEVNLDVEYGDDQFFFEITLIDWRQ